MTKSLFQQIFKHLAFITWILFNCILRTQKFRLDKTCLVLPRFHRFPLYRKLYPTYDSFLPALVKNLNDYAFIDVGANVGDTSFLVINSNKPRVLFCFEPHPLFYKYLVRNISNLTFNDDNCEFFSFNQPVSNQEKFNGLIFNNSTASQASYSSAFSQAPCKLDSMLNAHRAILSGISCTLLKVDTDGFDYDVINSMTDSNYTEDLIIYFELQISNTFQLDGYLDLFDHLVEIFDKFIIFDNIGRILFVGDLLLDIYKTYCFQALQNLTKSIKPSYYDVMVYTNEQSSIVDASLKTFSTQ